MYDSSREVLNLFFVANSQVTFANISGWMSFVDIYAPNAERLLVGNKTDLPKAVNSTVAEGFANQKCTKRQNEN